MKKRFFNFSRPYVFVPMCADFFHHGHINILIRANKLGNVIVGLMTDKGIKSYKIKKPFIGYNNRKKILQNIKQIKKVLPLNGLKFAWIAKKYKFDFFVHGDDWKKGPQENPKKELIAAMKKWKGKVIEVPYTTGVSTSEIRRYYIKK